MLIVTSYNDHRKLAHTQSTSTKEKSIKIFNDKYESIYENNVINPAQVYEENDLIYILTETIDENGQLFILNKQLNIIKSRYLSGKSSCHMNKFKNKYIITHYWDGKVEILDKNLETIKVFTQWEPEKKFYQIKNKKEHTENRQIGPHCHFSLNFKDLLLVTNLGNDIIYVYNEKMEEKSKIKLAKGSGVRNLVKYGDYIYTANELNNSITTIKYEKGGFKVLKTMFMGEKGKPSEIKIVKNYLFISIRTLNVINCYKIGKKMELELYLSIKTDNCPRSFDIKEEKLVVGSQKGGNVKIYKIKLEEKEVKLEKELKIEAANCVRFL